MTPTSVRVRRMGVAVVLGLAACGGEDVIISPTAPGPTPVADFGFFRGRWDVASHYLQPDGTFEETSAVSVIETEFASDAVLKETLTGTRNGEAIQVMTMRGRLGNVWTVARADAEAGTFDILSGIVINRTGVFTSNMVTRPDGGQTRATWSDFADDGTSFTVTLERSAAAGTPFETFWVMDYTQRESAVPAPPETIASSCTTPAHRGFDFWIGAWQTFNPSGTPNAPSQINLLLGGCVIEENWLANNGPGTSLNMYDARTDLWYQVWIDDFGRPAIFSGPPREDIMDMTRGPDSGGGGNTLDEWRWTPLPGGEVHQFGRTSSNGGASWTVVADLRYVPR